MGTGSRNPSYCGKGNGGGNPSRRGERRRPRLGFRNGSQRRTEPRKTETGKLRGGLLERTVAGTVRGSAHGGGQRRVWQPDGV